MSIFTKSKVIKSTRFSDFIRDASSKEKKRVYSDVMKKANDRQLGVIRRANTDK